MKLFISWSKPVSRRLALILREWLPEVIQQVDPWMSDEDIDKGQRWGIEVGSRLNELDQGVLCVTSENMREPWINFEAGALAKSLEGSRVRPLLFGLSKSDLTPPLALFQATTATDKGDMLKLVNSINKACVPPLERMRLERAFERNWDDFLDQVSTALASSGSDESLGVRRTSEDLMRETVERIRELQRFVEVAHVSSLRPGWQTLSSVFLHGGTALSGETVSHPELGPGRFLNLFQRKSGEIVAQVAFDAGETKNVGIDELSVLRQWVPARVGDDMSGPRRDIVSSQS